MPVDIYKHAGTDTYYKTILVGDDLFWIIKIVSLYTKQL